MDTYNAVFESTYQNYDPDTFDDTIYKFAVNAVNRAKLNLTEEERDACIHMTFLYSAASRAAYKQACEVCRRGF